MYGIVVLSIYALIMIGSTLVFTKKTSGTSFHVADRNIGCAISAFSIAATWIWAPSLFTSAEKAYVNGLPGLFWFLVPNALCLIFFIPFAKKIRNDMPEGVTLSGYMGEKYNSKVKHLYQFQLGSLSVFSTAVQLLAGGKILSLITGIPFWVLTIVLAAVAFSYAQFSGIKASVITDVIQLGIILLVCLSVVPCLVHKNGGVVNIVNGLNGISGQYRGLFDNKGIEVLLAFGLPTTIGLISGPFGDQSFWQRVFSIKKNSIGKAFLFGSLIFGIVPLSIGIIGYSAAGSGFVANDSGMVSFEYIAKTLPSWVIVPFLFMILSGLLSTVDSNLCSVASLTTDISRKQTNEENSKSSKLVMLSLLAAAIIIANIPGLTVTHLFMFYGTFRASTLLITILTLKGKKLSSNGVFAGVLCSMIIGLPVYAYGALANIAIYKTVGSLLSVSLSGIVSLILSKKGGNQKCLSENKA